MSNATDDQQLATQKLIFEIGHRAVIATVKACAERGDVLMWGKLLFPRKFKSPFCELHRYLVSIRLLPFTSTEAPRDHAKTTIGCFLIPIFQALVESERFRHYLNVQATVEKAIAVNVSIKTEIEENAMLREIYGNQVGRGKWTEKQFVLRNGVVFTAIGAGQSIRGIQHNQQRPDYSPIDDLYDDLDIENPESTKKKTDWFWSALFPAFAANVSSIHITGTAINAEDILEKAKTAPGIKTETFRAIIDHGTKTVLWPERHSFESLMKKITDLNMPLIIFNREYQNERRDDAESIVKRAWLKGWEYDPADLKFDATFTLVTIRLAIDPSIGEGLESDFTGMAVVLKCRKAGVKQPDFYIHALVNERLSMDDRLKKVEAVGAAMPKKLKIRLTRVEGIAGFLDFAGQVKKHAKTPVEIIKKVPDKITHLTNKSGLFQNGKVHLNKNIDTNLKEMLITQLTTNYPTHDDLRDAVLHGLDIKTSGWAHVGGEAGEELAEAA